eukprot:2026452-Rhodomonas_salina.1
MSFGRVQEKPLPPTLVLYLGSDARPAPARAEDEDADGEEEVKCRVVWRKSCVRACAPHAAPVTSHGRIKRHSQRSQHKQYCGC